MARFLRMLVTGLAFLGIAAGSTSAQVETRPNDSFELKEIVSIGDDESAPRESLFTNPKHIRTDADGRIYIVEGRAIGRPPGREVRVFSPDGEFLEILGRHGGAPGEFRDIQAIAIDSKDRLVVYDRRLDRFTRYSPFETIESFPLPDDERIATISNPKKPRISPGFMYGLQGGRFVTYYQGPKGERSPDQPRLHVYNKNFREVEAFGIPNDWWFPDDEFGRYLRKLRIPQQFGGSHFARDKSNLILAPLIYRGLLYRYTADGAGAWTLRRLEGRDPGHPTHEVIRSSDENFNIFGSGIGARFRSASYGVGQLNDGRILHLSTSEDRDGLRQLQLELFSQDGTLQKVGRIEGFVHNKTEFGEVNGATSVHLLWVDRRNRLYLVDKRGDFPIIRIMRLEH